MKNNKEIMATIILDSGFNGDDFVKNKRTVTVKYRTRGIVHNVLCFKVNDALWGKNSTYDRRVWRLVIPKINNNIFFIRHERNNN